ncbi:Gfo/Idh/MocA family oxidoreductase [Clostridium sp. SYSU_GA19001]|uniref:Gfo/Idh/MocA family protein n=1 Tax=Clostridium caldaquaticum TaxID=2940653 RepID=UPI0020775F3F|nr:Gfo/Idh/MocA family oxidoreductase [Clostridium caldaquaticum]MCM8709974.1 Gfo/Idh/MocA family oxidoreductase [Clostridium caldaquaticum]
MSIKFGIIGFGFMGHVHANTLAKLEEAELVAVCDIDDEKLSDAPEGVKVFKSMDELLAIKEIDVVILSVSNHVHKEAVIKAAKAGKHILLEKPAALSVEEFDEMMEVVKESGVKFSVHQQRRWDKDFRISKEVYDNNMVGDVYTIQTMLYGINGNMHDWHVYKKYGGGMLYDWGVHLIDQLLWMVDSKIKTIFADVRNVINEEVDDYFKIIFRFENGIVGEVELGTYFLADKEKWFERHWFIGGNKGSMYLDGFDPVGKIARTTRLLTNVPGKTTMTASGPTRSFGPPQPGVLVTEDLPQVDVDHIMYFENFLKALKGEEEFIVKPDQVRRVLAVMEAARKSAETGKSVDFE